MRVLFFGMPSTVHHTWIYVSVTPDGLQWPTREDSINSSNFARIPGRWISDTEFETTDGEVMLIPPTGADRRRRLARRSDQLAGAGKLAGRTTTLTRGQRRRIDKSY